GGGYRPGPRPCLVVVRSRTIDRSERDRDLDYLDLQGLEQPEDYAVAIVQDIIISDSKYPQTRHGLQVTLPRAVLKPAIVMTPAIELHDDAAGLTIEVHDIRPHGVLAAELRCRQSPVTK